MQKIFLVGNVSLAAVNFFNPVQEHIPLVEARMRDQANGHHPDLQTAIDHLLDSGGKRVRPTVALLSGGMFGADRERTITLAAAVELLHTATLVHDDVIDGALLRRGNPTLNSKWSPGATILTGDFIFARAAKLAAETDSIEIMNLFAQTLSTVVNGEITQMFRSKGLASREDYFNRIYAKTASMFELAAVAPLYLSEFGEEALEAMQRYGFEIGMAFQIVDDVLDFVSDQNEVGKPVANDLRQGLITLPALYYFSEFPNNDVIKAVLNNGLIPQASMERLVEGIRESGAIEKSMNEARMHVERGLDALEEMPSGPEHQALEELANFVIARDI